MATPTVMPIALIGDFPTTAQPVVVLNRDGTPGEMGGSALSGPLPAGTNTIGAVTQAGGPWSMSWAGQTVGATQSGAWTVALANGSTVGVSGSVVVTGTFWQSTQPISAASLPLPTGAATDVTLASVNAKLGGTLAISAASLPLPAGAATAAAQPALNADGGALAHVQNFPATQAVTGTFWQTTQPVSGTVTANPGVGTFAISAASLPLPSGAATSAKQPALGVAGTPSADVLSVQGITGGTPQPVSISAAVPTAVVSTALEGSHVLKNAPGALLSCYATTGTTAGYLMVFDLTAAPADGAVTPAACIYCPAQSTTSLDYQSGAPRRFATGITAVFSSTGPFTKTASASAFLEGVVV